MPAMISHYLFSKRVLTKISQAYPKFSINDNAYLWGAQGPDFLFSHKFLPWQKNHRSIKRSGAFLQKGSIEDIINMIKNYFKDKTINSLELSYIISFLSHLILDKNAYDFVSFNAKKLSEIIPRSSTKGSRNEQKSALDIILLRYEEQKLPTEINLKKLIPNDRNLENFIKDFYLNILIENYDKTITSREIAEALKDFKLFVSLMIDRTGLKKKFIKKLEAYFKKDNSISGVIRDITENDDYDYANFQKSQWAWPIDSNKIRTDSFFDIYESSITEAVQIVDSSLLNFPL
ncbi:MAG: hypothetical protein RUMPE_00612 [Eubacteriales bacterium SKADARSKE-1]|nr:hypothetical protein [Eubacteriales bacterium SKADARSKE-1]